MKHLPSTLPTLALTLALGGCTFTNEPDPGGFFEGQDMGLPGSPDAAALDAHLSRDSEPPPPQDAGGPELDAAGDQPDMGGLPDSGPPDAAPLDGDLPDGGLPDGDLPDGDLPDGDLPDGDPEPDLGPPGPEDLCDRACAALTDCGPGPDPAECRRECLAEDDDHPGTAARLDDCVAEYIADDRCDLPALQQCMSDEPLPIDPHCVIACDALGACEQLPARPDCAETCTEDPGPERQRLARCAEEHAAGGRCDGFGFLTCGGEPPTAADECGFVCDARAACDLDDAPCRIDCPDYDDATRRTAVDCAALHLDRTRCDAAGHAACLDR